MPTTLQTGAGLHTQLVELCKLTRYSHVFVVTDENVARHWLRPVLRTLHDLPHSHYVLPAGEQAKNIKSVQQLWHALHQAGCDRHGIVIALGGGVVGDMAAFAAATYMRGIACVQVPTTLLAQVDSSLGGKTGIDFDGVKNLVGTFSQPVAVIADAELLTTLPQRELIAGFGEIIKHGLIADAAYLAAATAKKPQDYTAAELARIVDGSCRIKLAVVAQDEHEAGRRKLLNAGHTVGHAFEALSLQTNQPLLHGEAVSIGLVIEVELAAEQGLLGANDATRVRALLAAAGLPVRAPRFAVSDLLRKMRSDKKNNQGVIRFTLLKGIGAAVWDQEINEEVLVATLVRNMEKS